MTDAELMYLLMFPAAFCLVVVAIAAPFELTERGRRFVARLVERWS